jgi:hypothetical protein
VSTIKQIIHFKNEIPNPLISENYAVAGDDVKPRCVDFEVFLDGDFDRCTFSDA